MNGIKYTKKSYSGSYRHVKEAGGSEDGGHDVQRVSVETDSSDQ